MPCQVCGKAPATVHLIEIVDAQKRVLHLCQGCADAKGSVIDPSLIQVAAAQIKKILGQAAPPGSGALAVLGRARCPHCGSTWKDFRKTNRFGCPHDYETLGADVEKLLRRIHGQVEHRGRTSERAATRLSRQRRLDVLQKDLDLAVKGEDFERAAELRDRIRCFERDSDTESAGNPANPSNAANPSNPSSPATDEGDHAAG